MKIKQIDKERFESYINKTDKCWEWKKSLTSAGYGQIMINGKTISSHRLSFLIYNGNIPKGLLVCHSCDNRRCCNPKHLFLGTYKDNMRDMIKKGRENHSFNPKGSKQWQSKLTEEQVLEIRRTAIFSPKKGAHGGNLKQLCEKYGIKHATLWNILKRRTWKHI